jgi:DTW domain-containing protein YfiP
MKKGHVGTGRLAHLSLINSEIIVDKDFDTNDQFNKLISNKDFSHYVLYPSDSPLNLSDEITQQ